MNLLNGLLILVTIWLLIEIVLQKKPLSRINVHIIIDIIIIGLHVVYVGFTWKVLALYMLPVFIIIYYMILHIEYDKMRNSLKRLYLIALILLQMFSALAVVIFPKVTFEEPSGTYDVGTTIFNLDDHNRDDPYAEGNREIRIQAWYPTKISSLDPVVWFLDGHQTLDALAEAYGFPNYILSHLYEVKTNSKRNTKMHSGKETYPVVIFSHGWSSSRLMHVRLLEALASHGYIVLAIDHPYIASVSRLENGDIAIHQPDILPEDDLIAADTMLKVMAADTEFLFSKLDALNDDHPILDGHMDLDNIGLMGHSSGSGAQMLFLQNRDVKAVVSLDGYIKPIDVQPIDSDSLFIASTRWLEWGQYDKLPILSDHYYELVGATHEDFTDFILVTPAMKWVSKSGGDYHESIEDLVLSYFNNRLLNMTDEVLEESKFIKKQMVK